jgi:hypothetical protein
MMRTHPFCVKGQDDQPAAAFPLIHSLARLCNE